MRHFGQSPDICRSMALMSREEPLHLEVLAVLIRSDFALGPLFYEAACRRRLGFSRLLPPLLAPGQELLIDTRDALA